VVPVYAEDGTYAGPSGSIRVWWNVDPEQWISLVVGAPSPAGEGPTTLVANFDVSSACSYAHPFLVPDVPPGTYTLVALETDTADPRNAAPFGPMTFEVTAP